MYESLDVELRLRALCLPVLLPEPLRPNRVVPSGRPRKLTFNVRRDWLLTRNEIVNSLSQRGRSTRDSAHRAVLRTLIRQIGRARERGNILRAVRLSGQADKVGRYNSTPIRPPNELEPVLDRMASEEFEQETGIRISERDARRIRSDEPLKALVGRPVYEVPEWLVEETRRIWLRQRAAKDLTPEVLAKVDRGEVVLSERMGGIAVLDPHRADGGEDTYMTAGGLLELQKWLAELLPSDYRRRPYWLAWSPQWRRIDAQPNLERVWINGQDCVRWDQHQSGRRIGPVSHYAETKQELKIRALKA